MSKSIHLRSALVGGLVAGLIVTALPAMAAVVGDALKLGKTNTINKTTTLEVKSRKPALVVDNTFSGPAVRAKGQKNVVKITADAGKAPIWVNAAAGTAKNLSADKLDGMDSTAFLGASATASDADLLDGMDSAAFATSAHGHPWGDLTGRPSGLDDGDDDTLALLVCSNGEVLKHNASTWACGQDVGSSDADTLDGLDSTDFLGASAQATDSDLLDGLDSTAFSTGPHYTDGDAVAAVMASDGSGSGLDSDQVDGYDANGLVRVAFDASGNLPDGDAVPFTTGTVGTGDVLSASITAPTAGWLIITGTVDATAGGSTMDFYGCLLLVSGNLVLGTVMNSQVNGTTNVDENCTTHGVQEMPAGTWTVTLRLQSVGSTTNFADGTLSVLFVPFDGTGGTSSL